MNSLLSSIPKKTYIIWGVFCIASIILKNPNPLIIFAGIYALSKRIVPLLNSSIFDTKVFAQIVSFFCYIILLQCTILSSWLISHNFPLNWTPFFTLFVIILITLWQKITKKDHASVKASQPHINTTDILAIAASLLVSVVILAAPVVRAQTDRVATLTMSLANGNVDDAAHVALMNDHLQFNRGITIKSDAIGKSRNQGFYPASWHAVAAIVAQTFGATTGNQTILIYGIQKLFWFFVILYLIIKLSFIFSKHLKISSSKISNLWVLTSSTLFGCIFLIPIMREGFFSFMPMLVAFLIITALILQLAGGSKKENESLIPIILILTIGGCLSWVLPLPAFFMVALASVLYLTITKNIPASIKQIAQIIYNNLVIIAILAAASITQLYVMSIDTSNESVSFIGGIVQDGGITKYTDKYLILLAIGYIIFLIFCNKRIKKNLHMLLLPAISMGGFSVLIYLIQLAVAGSAKYYYFKTLDIMIVSMIPLFCAGTGAIFALIAKPKTMQSVALATFLLLGSIIFIGVETGTIAYGGGYRYISNGINKFIYDELANGSSSSRYYEKNYVFFYTPGDDHYAENDVASLLIKSNKTDDVCFNNVRRAILVAGPTISSLYDVIDENCKDKSVKVVTDSSNYDIYANALKSHATSTLIKVEKY